MTVTRCGASGAAAKFSGGTDHFPVRASEMTFCCPDRALRMTVDPWLTFAYAVVSGRITV